MPRTSGPFTWCCRGLNPKTPLAREAFRPTHTGLFVPSADHHFIVGRLEDIEMRALGAICLQQRRNSEIARLLSSGEDIYGYTLARLNDAFDRNNRRRPEEYAGILKALFEAIALKLGPENALRIAESRLGPRISAPNEINVLYDRLLAIYPELMEFVHDSLPRKTLLGFASDTRFMATFILGHEHLPRVIKSTCRGC